MIIYHKKKQKNSRFAPSSGQNRSHTPQKTTNSNSFPPQQITNKTTSVIGVTTHAWVPGHRCKGQSINTVSGEEMVEEREAWPVANDEEELDPEGLDAEESTVPQTSRKNPLKNKLLQSNLLQKNSLQRNQLQINTLKKN